MYIKSTYNILLDSPCCSRELPIIIKHDTILVNQIQMQTKELSGNLSLCVRVIDKNSKRTSNDDDDDYDHDDRHDDEDGDCKTLFVQWMYVISLG